MVDKSFFILDSAHGCATSGEGTPAFSGFIVFPGIAEHHSQVEPSAITDNSSSFRLSSSEKRNSAESHVATNFWTSALAVLNLPTYLCSADGPPRRLRRIVLGQCDNAESHMTTQFRTNMRTRRVKHANMLNANGSASASFADSAKSSPPNGDDTS
jgi:hypothetical protein